MSRVFFTSDPHLEHEHVATTRGFSTTAAHDAELAYRWDATVRPEDDVWVTGDVCVGGSALTKRALEWVNRRPGVKHLVPGNHCRVHPHNRDAHRWQRTYLEVAFESVQPFARRRIDGQDVLLSHFPYVGDSGPYDRYTQYRLPCEGLPIIHGHTHSRSRFSTATYGPAEIPVPQVHVGVDAWDGYPVRLEAVAEVLRLAAL